MKKTGLALTRPQVLQHLQPLPETGVSKTMDTGKFSQVHITYGLLPSGFFYQLFVQANKYWKRKRLHISGVAFFFFCMHNFKCFLLFADL